MVVVSATGCVVAPTRGIASRAASQAGDKLDLGRSGGGKTRREMVTMADRVGEKVEKMDSVAWS